MAREKSQTIVSSYDHAEDINVFGQYVWDSGSLSWIKAVPAGGGGGGGLTDAELRATPVPVSGPLTDAQLRALAVPVSGTFFQGTQPISAAALPLPAGAATEATLATRLTESDFDTKTGSLTEAAPGTDTASSGLNGRLQRIAQRLTSLIALLPAALVSGRLDVNIGASPATVPVSGTFFQATQPVSVAATLQVDVTDEPTRDMGKIDIASLDQYTPVSGRLPVDGSGVTQPVSISATVNTAVTSIDGEGTIATAQVSVGVAAATVVASRAGRRSLLIVNHGTTPVFLGPATVTTANGVLLPGVLGASISIPTTALVQGIVASGTQTVSYIEVF